MKNWPGCLTFYVIDLQNSVYVKDLSKFWDRGKHFEIVADQMLVCLIFPLDIFAILVILKLHNHHATVC